MTLHLHRQQRHNNGSAANPATAPPDPFNLRAALTKLDKRYSVDTELVAQVMGVDVNRIIAFALGEDASAKELASYAPGLTRLLDAAERLDMQHVTGHALNLALWPRIGEFQTGISPEISSAATPAASFGGSAAQEKKSA